MQYFLKFIVGFATYNWFWWCVAPVAAAAATWFVKRRKDEGGWNGVGRDSAAIGYSALSAAFILFLLSIWKPATFGFVAVPELSALAKGSDWVGVVLDFIARATNYSWICPLLPLVVWMGIANICFIGPGRRMAAEKTSFR
jgi:hypothetical protein